MMTERQSQEKAELQAKIDADKEAFLAGGGQIQHYDRGVQAEAWLTQKQQNKRSLEKRKQRIEDNKEGD